MSSQHCWEDPPQRICELDLGIVPLDVLRLIDTCCDSHSSRYVKSFVEAAGATLPRPDLPDQVANAIGSGDLRTAPNLPSCRLPLSRLHHRPRRDNTLELEADHRRHAEIENVIRDLKYGAGLNHLPSGRFAANAAWLAIQVMAQNVARWAARISLGDQPTTTKTRPLIDDN